MRTELEPNQRVQVSVPRMKTKSSPQAAHLAAYALALGGVLGLFAGCASEPESHVVSAPPPVVSPNTTVTTSSTTTSTPVVTTTTPVATTATVAVPTNTIVVAQPPPAAQQEVVLARPSPDHIWIDGYWTWRNSRYEWMAGHWEIPPRSGSVWVAPRWEREGNAYRFYEGYWN